MRMETALPITFTDHTRAGRGTGFVVFNTSDKLIRRAAERHHSRARHARALQGALPALS
jgi:hypothetical protein